MWEEPELLTLMWFRSSNMSRRRIKHLLKCLLKTAPPVLIFCEKKADVDAIHEYLLREVAAVAIHGGMDQEEREYAISSFKAGKKDVLVATDNWTNGKVWQHWSSNNIRKQESE
ncbi:LOW QUALITY PROTEIN: P-loop containing nucleoside triphosphate hydrolase [Trema orientale]|uniref:P-loop containing nucleoside triphosphate hydrolase n=1 Tax=Trema orientale TaxID=63057 RepID=A0A2P5FDC6_TREOI|nr:LOW QUALITY PROTEIN: P-loop containing nucleoside triphosphate hydrolase [Trema orientale]